MHAIWCCKQGCERVDLAHMNSSKERVKGTDYVNCTCLILQLCSIIKLLWHMHIILFEARDLSNAQAKKLVSLFALSLARPVKARSQKRNLATTSISMVRSNSSRESSCLANCSPLHVSVHCRVVFARS